MKKFSLFAVLCFSLALILSACGGKSDADLQKEVAGKINTPGVTAAVKDGVVTLTGTVETQAASKTAESAAKVEGVKSVTNNIQIKPVATPMPPLPTMPTTMPPTTSMSPGAKPGASPMANAARR